MNEKHVDISDPQERTYEMDIKPEIRKSELFTHSEKEDGNSEFLTESEELPDKETLLEAFFSRQSTLYDITQEEFPKDYNMQEYYEEIRYLNDRNESENRLHQAIADGDVIRAKMELRYASAQTNSSFRGVYSFPADPLRQFKNSVISMNALFRKAVETNHVPFVYINHHSTRFTYLIESASRFEEIGEIVNSMVETYCLLSRKYSMSRYSDPVRKCILYLELNMDQAASLKLLASEVSVTPNYLSALFKKETGLSITDYIKRKRIQQACILLRHSNYSVSEIAGQVGIPDPNYFTKVFRQYTGETPRSYRMSGAEL